MHVQVPSDSWLAHILTASNVKNVTLWGISFLCAALAWLGGCLFVYVLLSRYFLPATANYSRSLYFDYTKADAVATAHFLPDTQYHRASLSEVSCFPMYTVQSGEHWYRMPYMQAAAAQARFLSPKQRFDVWLELATPEAHAYGGDEIFQVRPCKQTTKMQPKYTQCYMLFCVPGSW